MERPIDSRVLLYVVTVAEEGNITRAARTKLFIAPGSLARDIRNLERRIGYPLFTRRRSGVALTPAGVVFVEEARKSLVHSQRAIDRGAAASRGETGVLHIGFTPFLDAARLLEITKKFAEALPDIVLKFESAYCCVQLDLVLREVLDAGLIILPPESDEVGTQRVWRTDLVVAIPEESPLARRGPIALREIAGHSAIWLAREVNPALYDRVLDTCHKAGWVPNIVRHALTYDEMLDAISRNLGVGFVKESTARRMQMEGVVFRGLQDVRLSVEIGVVYRSEKSSRALQALLHVLEELSDCDKESPPQIRPT